jgi:hypothetical protein
MIKRIVMLFVLAGVLQANAQFVFDARTKSVLDIYYLKKGVGTVTGSNIVHGSITTNNFTQDIIDKLYLNHQARAGLGLTQTIETNGYDIITTINLVAGTMGPVIASGIWGIWIDGTVSLLPVPLMARSGYWLVETNGWIGIADLLESDAVWTTNTSGEIVLR